MELFKKTPSKQLKKLGLLRTQYCHDDLTPMEVTTQEREKFKIKKKSYGYFENHYYFNKIELVDNNELNILTNVLTEKDCENLINLF